MSRGKKAMMWGLVVLALVILSRPVAELIVHPDSGQTLADHLSPQRIKILIPDRLIKMIAPQPSTTVLDVGAGYGLLTFPLARAVGSTGTVIATDVDPQAVKYLKEQARKENLGNVRAVKVAPVSVDDFYGKQSYDTVLLCDLPSFVTTDRFLVKLRPQLKKDTGRLWVVSFTMDPDFAEIELKECRNLLEILRSDKVQSVLGPRLRPETRAAIGAKTATPDSVTPLLMQDLNKMLDDQSLWPQLQAQKWPLGQRYAFLVEGMGRGLDKEKASKKATADVSRLRLRLLNRLIIMDLLDLNVWGEAIAWSNMSKKSVQHLLEEMDGWRCRPETAVKDLLQRTGYDLVKEHHGIPHYYVLEFRSRN